MRQYGVLWSSFWTGDTGRQLGKHPDAQRLAAYLVTGPMSNMIGLYYLPLPMICHDVQMSEQGALEALQRVDAANFAYYHSASSWVFVPEMAHYQLGPTISTKDNRHTKIVKLLEECRKCVFAKDFWAKYRESYSLPNMEFARPIPAGFKGACKGLGRGGDALEEGRGEGEGRGKGEGTSRCGVADKQPRPPADLSQVAFPEFPCVPGSSNGAGSWLLTEAYLAELGSAYPGLDVPLECRRAHVWVKANPSRRKTARGMSAFLARWLDRAQNSGRSAPAKPVPRLPTPEELANYNGGGAP